MTAVLVVMGVSASGKSTIARRLSALLGWDFADADDLHPASNIEKMCAGEALSDADREPWLRSVAGWIDAQIAAGRSAVIACSALRRGHRDILRRPEVTFVYLAVPRAELERRIRERRGHFMPASLLGSQMEALEPPTADEQALGIDATPAPDLVASAIAAAVSTGS